MTKVGEARLYSAQPCYPAAGEQVQRGWDALARRVPGGVRALALDGPAVAPWAEVVTGLGKALEEHGRKATFASTSARFLPWRRVQELTSSYELRDDPDFDFLASGRLSDLFASRTPPEARDGELSVVYGPGAGLVPHDALWYMDLPKRYAEAAVTSGGGTNLGQPPGTGSATTKRLFYIDWPLLDRHRDEMIESVQIWADFQRPEMPSFLDGHSLRKTLAQLATIPFRTRPTFNTTPWGGHWGQTRLGYNPGAANTALGYELIAPEAGVLVGDDDGPQVEVPFQLIVSCHPVQMLGEEVHRAFGTSFPVRFDYLDTLGGGNLSVHCHPQAEYMRSVFGWPYTQHESYYMMVGGRENEVFLGLHQATDVSSFERDARLADEEGKALDVRQYVASFPAQAHDLFLIPSGTPHGSGAGNVVLEVSATPYLYSLRFYDWLRRGRDGGFRPVHVNHAFRNLDPNRRGEAVKRDLLQPPRAIAGGPGWEEQLLGALAEMFFEVRRLNLEPGAMSAQTTGGRFHVLNVVDGDGVLIEMPGGRVDSLVYAETMVVPASVGDYLLRPLGASRVRLVKALVR
ncbi:MAG TPA: hypothetical protein VL984_00665 [Acidimicrobiales bacterium]|nr:hypothetical protein [Acidimicrobiales bacterium]